MSAQPCASKFQFVFYSSRPDLWGLDGIPFGGVYGVTISAVLAAVAPSGSFGLDNLLWLLLPASLHALLFLSTHWSVEVRCWARFREEPQVHKASHVKVVPRSGAGHASGHRTMLVPVHRQDDEVSILYQKKKYVYSHEGRTFERLKYNVKAPLEDYLAVEGLNENQATALAKKYGTNVYDIPLPTFWELFQEHAVSPFFVFQVVCVLLWLMDEYWYYSLMTLFMLIFAEGQMVQRRLHDLGELRAMRIPARQVHVLRAGSWKVLTSDDLLPGDIMAITRQVDAPFPCDVLLLQGSVLMNESMLTGESVPQMKVPVEMLQGSADIHDHLDIKGLHKQHIVSAGTSVILHQNTSKLKSFKKVPQTGDSVAAVGYVLRIGFDTTQGKLCRTILFSAERVTVSSKEAVYFLMILLAFAVLACAYILHDGFVAAPARGETPRSTFKLLLAVSHIITAVVPPEFPIMLSLAVNLSLVALLRKAVFCTEPFRVPLAGKVNTCCFDKTGTLTSDSMEVAGVYGLPSYPPASESQAKGTEGGKQNGSKVTAKQQQAEASLLLKQPLPFLSTAVMAACSGLTVIDGEVVGDPLEKAALQAIGWSLLKHDLVCARTGKTADRLQVLRRYPFVSELQRMAVLVWHQGPAKAFQPASDSTVEAKQDHDRCLALVKGSCEAMKPRLRQVPEGYDDLLQSLTKNGLRVLCLGAKELPNRVAKGEVDNLDREELESNLEFCGLLALRNAIKPQVAMTVRQLRRSYHRVLMITGDHPMTACQVAFSINMAEKPFVELEPVDPQSDTSALQWRLLDGQHSSPPKAFVLSEVQSVADTHSLCVPGRSAARLTQDEMTALAPFVTVFARVSPQQKEQVVQALNRTSHTMMVGDGTNDVGALKHAHVGVSLMSIAPDTSAQAPGRRARDPRGPAAQQMQAELANLEGQVPMVRLGDASIASPFTHKGDSIRCSTHILKCGRSTQSTVLMMHKVMGLNSVISAFAMSVLTLDGVKLGDLQTSLESILTSACFFLVSRSLPAKQLSKILPSSSVFAWPVMLSLIIQLIVHLTAFLYGWQLAKSYRPKDFERDLEGEFEPNLTNTVIFMIMATSHASSFLSNYEGHPFMMPMSTNKALFNTLMVFIVALAILASEVMPALNSSLSLVLAPDETMKWKVFGLMTADLVVTVGVSKVIRSVALHMEGQLVEQRALQLGLGLGGSSMPSAEAEE